MCVCVCGRVCMCVCECCVCLADLGQRPDPAGARTSIADMEEM